jgi:hypothetical protein
MKVESTIQGAQSQWINNNTEAWENNTPFIFNYHKQAEMLLQNKGPNSSFITFKLRNK